MTMTERTQIYIDGTWTDGASHREPQSVRLTRGLIERTRVASIWFVPALAAAQRNNWWAAGIQSTTMF
jgi:aldehyde dehydrogenase (NAD+)